MKAQIALLESQKLNKPNKPKLCLIASACFLILVAWHKLRSYRLITFFLMSLIPSPVMRKKMVKIIPPFNHSCHCRTMKIQRLCMTQILGYYMTQISGCYMTQWDQVIYIIQPYLAIYIKLIRLINYSCVKPKVFVKNKS